MRAKEILQESINFRPVTIKYPSGKIKDVEDDFPEMNVSDVAAKSIINSIGIPYGGTENRGTWKNSQLPAVEAKLLSLLHQGQSSNNLQNQVKMYAERLLRIIDFAKKHNHNVSWE